MTFEAEDLQATYEPSPKQRKYYKVGEMVFVKATKETGEVTKLDIVKAKGDFKGVYKATVRIGKQEKVLDLWEVDKLRTKETPQGRKRDTLLFAKVRPDAIIPSKRAEDGCFDIYANFEQDMVVIHPNEVKLVPTGIASSFSPKYRFNCKRERSSTGKIGLMVASGQIDSGYRGEWFIALYNPTSKPIAISKLVTSTVTTDDYVEYPYTKAICQAALELVPVVDVKEIPYTELSTIPSQRGTGALGSSGK